MSSLVSNSKPVTARPLEREIEMMQGWRDTLHIDYESMMSALSVGYTNLLKELHAEQTPVMPEALEAFSKRPQELVVLLMKNTELLGTAQASLSFPALVPTVHISNVVVRADVRDQGHGTRLMNAVVELSEQKWGASLVFWLTSQEKRGTKAFYEKLGFWSTPTIRYRRFLQ
jgi:ribosomal protein S18 acetylase RimI-like enzyme